MQTFSQDQKVSQKAHQSFSR